MYVNILNYFKYLLVELRCEAKTGNTAWSQQLWAWGAELRMLWSSKNKSNHMTMASSCPSCLISRLKELCLPLIAAATSWEEKIERNITHIVDKPNKILCHLIYNVWV